MRDPRKYYAGAYARRNKEKIFDRDGWQCVYCGYKLQDMALDNNLELDHLIPLSWSITKKIDKIVTACKKCNIKLSNISLFTLEERKEFLKTNIN